MKNLCTAMAEAFKEIEGATKSANNPHFKSKYADIGAVIDAVKPALIAHGLFFTQRSQPSDDGVTVETVLHHSSGEEMSLGSLYVPANKRDAQGFGSALTYARRYALMTAFGVPAEDDDGNAAVKAAPANTNSPPRKDKDLPFPQGPAKNLTDLKSQGRDFWRQVEGTGDDDELTALIASHSGLIKQIKEALPSWWDGYERDGTPHEGLFDVINRKQADFGNAGWKNSVLIGG